MTMIAGFRCQDGIVVCADSQEAARREMCADRHGFSIDVLSEGGASGSPIFFADDPRAIGILHAGFNGVPITYRVPGHLVKAGLGLLRD